VLQRSDEALWQHDPERKPSTIKENDMSTTPRSPEEPSEPDPDKLLDPDAPPNPDDPDMPDGPDSATPIVPADPKNGEQRM
jgi:hypothetical protein